LSNDTYKLADAHHRHREFNEGIMLWFTFVLNAILNMLKGYMPESLGLTLFFVGLYPILC